MRVQLPLLRRILDEYPRSELHIWNLARNRSDNWWLRSLSGERMTVRNEFFKRSTTRYRDVYRWYAAQSEFADTVFVKVDDDVVFLQTDRFRDFVTAVADNPGAVVSAKTINNGASTRIEKRLWERFTAMQLPLLDIHLHRKTAAMAHEYFFEYHKELLAQPVKVIDTKDWLSINAVGFDFEVMKFIAEKAGEPAPAEIAGRKWTPRDRLGDEGICNMLPRKIVQGFLACHLAFGPQFHRPTDPQFQAYRDRYQQIGKQYLEQADVVLELAAQ